MFNTVKKYYQLYRNPDCLSCILRLQLGTTCYFMPVIASCSHFASNADVKFSSPKKFKLLTYCTIIWVLAFLIYNIRNACHFDFEKHQAMALIEMVLCFNTSISCLAGCWKLRHKVNELNGLVAILGTKEKFHLAYFFDGEVARNVAIVSTFLMAWVIIQELFIVIYTYFANENATIDSVLKIMTMEFVFCYGAATSSHFYIINFVYGRIFAQCYRLIKRDLLGRDEKRFNVLQPHWCLYNSLNYKLQLLCRLYVSLVRNFREGLSHSSLPNTVSWTTCIIVYIVSFYIFLVEQIYGSEGTILTAFLKLKILIMAIGVTPHFFIGQWIADQILTTMLAVPIRVSCQHFGKLGHVKFYKSKICLFFMTWLCSVMFGFSIYNAAIMFDTGADNQKTVIILVETLMCITIVMSSFYGIYVLDYKIKELNGMSQIVRNKMKFNVRTFLHEDLAHKIAKLSFGFAAFLITSELAMILIKFCLDENLVLWEVVKVFTVYACFHFQSFCSFHFIVLIIMYKALFAKCYEQIILNLQMYPSQGRLHLSCRLYIGLLRNLREGEEFCGVPFVIVWNKFIIVFIASLYIFIVEGMHGTENRAESLLLKCKMCFALTGIVGYLFLLESLANSSNDVLSFLFRYPISKLSASEAAQVEVLITALTIQKPILTASNIFTIGTRLLASISGTVVTYLLVALQFHVSWTKKALQTTK